MVVQSTAVAVPCTSQHSVRYYWRTVRPKVILYSLGELCMVLFFWRCALYYTYCQEVMYVAVGCRPSRKIQVLDKEPSCPYLEHSNQSILIPAGELSSELELILFKLPNLFTNFYWIRHAVNKTFRFLIWRPWLNWHPETTLTYTITITSPKLRSWIYGEDCAWNLSLNILKIQCFLDLQCSTSNF